MHCSSADRAGITVHPISTLKGLHDFRRSLIKRIAHTLAIIITPLTVMMMMMMDTLKMRMMWFKMVQGVVQVGPPKGQ